MQIKKNKGKLNFRIVGPNFRKNLNSGNLRIAQF